MSSQASGHASREDCVYGPFESPEYRKYTEMCDELRLMVECGSRGIPVEVWKKDTKTIVRDAFADALDQLSGRKAGVIDLSPGHAKTDKT